MKTRDSQMIKVVQSDRAAPGRIRSLPLSIHRKLDMDSAADIGPVLVTGLEAGHDQDELPPADRKGTSDTKETDSQAGSKGCMEF